jgi:hypothetical protein
MSSVIIYLFLQRNMKAQVLFCKYYNLVFALSFPPNRRKDCVFFLMPLAGCQKIQNIIIASTPFSMWCRRAHRDQRVYSCIWFVSSFPSYRSPPRSSSATYSRDNREGGRVYSRRRFSTIFGRFLRSGSWKSTKGRFFGAER